MAVRWWSVLLTAGTLASAFSAPSVAGCDGSAWRQVIKQYSQRYPRAEAADLYKLAHQGIMGSEHAVTDMADASAWMRRELATLSTPSGTIGDTTMLEPLPPDGRFARVNLRPFIANGGDAETLVRAFVATANQSKGDTAQFVCVERALSGTESAPVMNQLVSLIHVRRRAGFDAVHHSAAFESAYSPAYRVIRASLADSLLIRKN